MRYENPFYMIEDAGAADLIAGGRLQLGISRGSPEQVIEAGGTSATRRPRAKPTRTWRRRHAEVFLELLGGRRLRAAYPRPMFANPPGLLRLEPHSEGPARPHLVGRRLERHRGLGRRTGMNLQSSTLKFDESGEPFHVQQAGQIRDTATRGRRPATRASRAFRSAARSFARDR